MVPLVVRLAGTNVEEGRKNPQGERSSRMHTAESLTEAARIAVDVAKTIINAVSGLRGGLK